MAKSWFQSWELFKQELILNRKHSCKVFISQECRQQLCLNSQPATAQTGSSSALGTASKSLWWKPIPELPFSYHLPLPKLHFSNNHPKGFALIREEWLSKVSIGKCWLRGGLTAASLGNLTVCSCWWEKRFPPTHVCTVSLLPSHPFYYFSDPFCELNQFANLAGK